MMASSAATALPLHTAADDENDAPVTVLRVKSLLLFSEESPDVCVSLYDDPRVYMDVAEDLTLLLGFERKLYTVSGPKDVEKIENGVHNVFLRIIVDTEDIYLEENEYVTGVKWLSRELFCVGYTSGIVRMFSRVGQLIFEQKLHSAAVQKLDVNRNAATMVTPRRASVLHSGETDIEGEFWVLYADATVVIIQISEILANLSSNSAALGPAHASKLRKYLLRDQKNVMAAIPCGPVRPTIFQSHSRLGVYTILSAGSAPFLAFYQAGNDQNSIIHLAHIASAIASRAAGAMWNFATSWGWGKNTGGITNEEKQANCAQLGASVTDAAAEHVPAPVSSTRSIYEDERRRCRVLVLSPTGRLAAVSDTLGRILLVDTSQMIKYGVHDMDPEFLVLRESEVIELKLGLPNASILLRYFTQNKLQEENFLLHQVIGGLRAYVKKKRVDMAHTIEQDALDPLLVDIGGLSSSTTIQTLLDVLCNADMALLNASFLLKALKKLQLALKNGFASRTPTGLELSLHWRLLWQHRVVSTYIGFQSEFARGKRAFMSLVQTSTREIMSRSSTEDQQFSPLPRVLQWFELLRRAGLALDDESCTRTCRVTDSASQLTAWAFMDYFSMPFSDPDLPRRRDILSVFEAAETTEEFLRNAFRVLKTPIFRKSLTSAQRDCLFTFIFAPMLSSVFAVQEIQQLHSALFLTEEITMELFIEWYFSLPLGAILALPPPSMSSSLQRWLQPYFVITDVEAAIQQKAIFNACRKTPELLHAFVLSEHCGWAEKQSAKYAEEDTFGNYSSVGGGVRWIIMQDCIAKTVHLSLRLEKVGRLSVDAVEQVDDIMRSLAVMQINDSHETDGGNAVVQLTNNNVDVSISDDDTDSWVATMENCRKAAQMKDWAAVLRAYPQFSNKNALCCFRIATLCAAWNVERSNMRQLEDALLELDCLDSIQVRAGMAAYVWERYIRVHVTTLITFWEESAVGRKPQRGFQPQVARRFFSIIRDLLETLLASVKTIPAVQVVSTAYGSSEVDGETSDCESESGDEDDGDHVPRVAVFKLESLTQSVKWHFQVKDLRAVYRREWPPSHETSALMQTLQKFKLDVISASQIADHIALIMLLDSFAATKVTPISIVKLFSNSGRYLCRPDSFFVTQSIAEASEEEATCIRRDRTRFLKELLRHDETLGFALAEAFGLPLKEIREEYVLFLYQSGRDEQADLAIEKMQRPERIVLKLGAIARARLSLVLRRMKTEAEYAVLMSMLPADVFAWVTSDTQPPLVADPLVEKLDITPSLTSTHYLLLKCLAMITPNGEVFEKVSAMSVLVKDVISQVKVQPYS
ncbi:unnamed protein product [Peronospora belbahrii]|uniref:Rab3-GAP regulatory subunit N-terminal domain-containing protein n=1 Tax=Peronospora belbahrii TaxID=622444 RepID=A0AAU9LBH8_9STRA|nr:unnamed protein product [Peronospora belbahrii]